jgi:hypothetical protein
MELVTSPPLCRFMFDDLNSHCWNDNSTLELPIDLVNRVMEKRLRSTDSCVHQLLAYENVLSNGRYTFRIWTINSFQHSAGSGFLYSNRYYVHRNENVLLMFTTVGMYDENLKITACVWRTAVALHSWVLRTIVSCLMDIRIVCCLFHD